MRNFRVTISPCRWEPYYEYTAFNVKYHGIQRFIRDKENDGNFSVELFEVKKSGDSGEHWVPKLVLI